MTKRKYVRYTLVADCGQVQENYENYSEVSRAYWLQYRSGNPATLYGFDSQGDASVIRSCG